MKNARGFTLIEMVAVIIIIGILAAAIAPMALSALNAYNATLNSVRTLDKLRYATERLAREMRAVNHNGASFDFTSMSTTAPVFINTDGTTVRIGTTITPPAVTLGYSTTLTPTLTDQLSTLAFAYFEQDGTTSTTSPTNVRYVEISLALLLGSQTYVQRTRVALRDRI